MTHKELDRLWFQAMEESIKDGEMVARYHFAALVAAAERERIIAKNAPVIEKINAHIKALESLRDAAKQALEALNHVNVQDRVEIINNLRAALAEPQIWVCPDSAEHRYGKPGHCEDCGKTLVQVAEPVQELQRKPLTEIGDSNG